MRSGLVQAGAWAVATTAAVVLSWLGVNAVLSDSAFEPPAALPLRHSPSPAGPTGSPGPPPAQTGPAGQSGQAGPAGQDPSGPPSSPQAAPTGGRGTLPATTRRPTTAAPGTPATGGDGGGAVRSYLVPGGRVALDMYPDRAELVSAVPDPGWQMQMWNGDQWMRIDFSQGQRTNSVFVTWNGHPPDVQTVVNGP